ncbi:hypothetical protein CD351_13370 [Erythrobacter sp. KY5]|nr:hypothetical protein CD351_13370 [Erythrobacter sp. KY5]
MRAMMILHPPLAPREELWRFRSKVLLVTLIAISVEIALHAVRFLGVWQDVFYAMYAVRFVVLMATCLLAYVALEWVERVGQAAAIMVLGLGFFPLAIAHALAMRAVGGAMGWLQGELGPIIFAAESWAQFLLLWGAAVLASFYHIRLSREQSLRREASAAAHRARMRAVRYRLNPHFLFNTLNSIGLLALEKRKSEAEALINRLASFLRASLHKDAGGYHTLANEFAQVEDYLKIELVRFPDRLTTRLNLPATLENAAVPPFLIQPMIEQAIGEGVSRSSQPVAITLQARDHGDTLVIELRWVSETVADESTAHRSAPLPGELSAAIPADFDLEVRAIAGGMQVSVSGPLVRLVEETSPGAHLKDEGQPPLSSLVMRG